MARKEIDPLVYAALLHAVREVADPWRNSPYYENAEPWTHVFWQAGRFRRLFDRLDPARLVELAVGHGRHAEHAARLAGQLWVVDVLEENIEICRARLGGFSNVLFIVNDGFSFQPLEEGSVTGIYCYDAMVHFGPELVAAYLHDTARVLAPGGRALFHHSNHEAPRDRFFGYNPHARNHMTQALFAGYTAQAGLEVLESEVLDWGEAVALDCLTLVEKRG